MIHSISHLTVFLKIPTGGNVADGTAGSPFLLNIGPFYFPEIDFNIFKWKITSGTGSMLFTDNAICQFVLHKLQFVAAGPAHFENNGVDMRSIGASQGKLRCCFIKLFGEIESIEVSPLSTVV
jgi:hypothetical protein